MNLSSKHHELVALIFNNTNNPCTVSLYNTQAGMQREIRKLKFDCVVGSIALRRCGTVVAASLPDGLIEIRSWDDKVFKKVLEGHTNDVSSLLFSRCGSFIISGSMDCTVKIWDYETTKCLKTIDCDSMITSMTLHPIEKEILVGTHDGMLTVIGMDGLKKHQVVIEARTPASSFAIHGDSVYVGLFNGYLQRLDIENLGRVIWAKKIHSHAITDLCIRPF
jgi:WD40 repeat protein